MTIDDILNRIDNAFDTPRDPKRIDIVLGKLGEYWKAHPDMRLGQILVNMTTGDLFHVEDTDLLVAITIAINEEGEFVKFDAAAARERLKAAARERLKAHLAEHTNQEPNQ
jgi:uncharacterized protein YihD (DUF1040 family)